MIQEIFMVSIMKEICQNINNIAKEIKSYQTFTSPPHTNEVWR